VLTPVRDDRFAKINTYLIMHRVRLFCSPLQAYTARSCATVFDTFIADMETTRRDDAVKGRLQTSPSPILLQHDTTRVNGSVSRVAEIIDRLRAVGFTFVRIDECFDYGAGMVAPFAPQVAVGGARKLSLRVCCFRVALSQRAYATCAFNYSTGTSPLMVSLF
jgi:hypothetical protein